MARQVIVVGGGLGGMSAAIHARLRGWDVLLLEAGERVGGKAARIVEGGFVLDPGPSIIILKSVYEAVFAAAGRRMEDYLTFRRLDVISRLCFEGSQPVNLPANEGLCLQVLDDLAPKDGKAVRSLLNKLERVAPIVDRTVFAKPYLKGSDLADPGLMKFGMVFNPFQNYRQMVDRMFESPVLRAFFYGFPSYGGQTYDSKAPGALLIPYYMIREGTYFPVGGVRAIPEAFERLALELGVEIRTGTRVGRIVGEDACRGVELLGGERINADAVICNVDPLTMMAERDGVKEWEPSLSYFTAHWGFGTECRGLEHHTLCVPKGFERGFEQLYRERVFPDSPIVYLNAVGGMDPEAAGEGRSLVFAVVTSPAETDGFDWMEKQDSFLERTMEVVERCGVRLPWESLQLERIQSPPYFRCRHGNYRGSLYGPDERHRLFGLFPMGNRDERWPNLVYCGGAVQPGAGLPMVTLSGKFAAGLLD